MILYSETISAFLQKTTTVLRQILTEEMNLQVGRSRFVYQGLSVPFSLVVFENPTQLGYFVSDKYRIGLNKKLIYNAKETVIKNILRHELAHFINFLENGQYVLPHGAEYKEICQRFGWDFTVSAATADIDEENNHIEGETEREKIIIRIKKLLALSSSNNIHEAEQATMRANQLLLDYNLKNISDDSDKEYCSLAVVLVKRSSPLLTAIYHILETFNVKVILNKTKAGAGLDIVGDRVNVELAEYMAHYLVHELPQLFKKTGLVGTVAKNSFYTGVANGIKLKSKIVKEDLIRSNAPALTTLNNLEKNLAVSFDFFFPRIRRIGSNARIDGDALEAGINAGKNLSWRAPLKNNESSTLFLS
jgi:hypothetical protein